MEQMKCDNGHPVCANCKTYAKDCIYVPLSTAYSSYIDSAGSPSNSGDFSLSSPTVTDKRRRRESSSASRSPRPAPDVRESGRGPDFGSNLPSPGHDPVRPCEARSEGVSRIVVSSNGVSSYHGRTSTLYEDHIPDKPPTATSHPRMPDDWIEKGLVAEAARQRQLEAFNYHAGSILRCLGSDLFHPVSFESKFSSN